MCSGLPKKLFLPFESNLKKDAHVMAW